MRLIIIGLLGITLSACTSPKIIQTITPVPAPLVAPTPPPKPSFTQEGQASWYGNRHHGKKTASGERFNQHDLTAAHRTLPFNSKILVTNLDNGKSVTLRINDRGPYSKKRVLDVSRKAAEILGMSRSGTARVRFYTVDE